MFTKDFSYKLLKTMNMWENNDYYQIYIVAWNHVIEYELLVLYRNTWYHLTLWKLYLL